MENIGSYQAKTHLPKLLERVSQGEQFIITKHGIPVAKLIPITTTNKEKIIQAINELEKIEQEHTLDGLNLKEMIEQGRR